MQPRFTRLAKGESDAALIVSLAYENGAQVAKVTRFGDLPDHAATRPSTSEPRVVLAWAAQYERQFAVPVRIRLQGVAWNPIWGILD